MPPGGLIQYGSFSVIILKILGSFVWKEKKSENLIQRIHSNARRRTEGLLFRISDVEKKPES